MNLRSDIQLGRELAKKSASGMLHLRQAQPCRSVETVVDVPSTGDAPCVCSHYPSPSGRLDRVPGPPPVFSSLERGKPLSRQEFAQSVAAVFSPLAGGVALSHTDVSSYNKTRGKTTCVHLSGLLRPWHRPHWRAVVTASLNAQFMAPARALSVRLSSMAMLAQAQPSAQPQTSPIAKHIRPAVNTAVSSAIRPDQRIDPIVAVGCGGVFVAICPGAAAPDQEPEGTKDVQ